MMILPTLTLISTFVVAGVTSFCVEREVSENAPTNLVNPPVCHDLQQAVYSMTLVTTGITSALTCYKMWVYRREIGQYLSVSEKKTRTEKVMLIIVESGVFYFLILLEFIIRDIPKVSNAEYTKYTLAFTDLIWTYMTTHLLGIYPALMVILGSKPAYAPS
ncbi:hypothetical protein QCA50_020881 [Cerrena zonata]|uniref:Uncharacterized protein n=1 Tax=Cerrena zonata TaxID=2478898 RepID=A0AAW0F741_9APHY